MLSENSHTVFKQLGQAEKLAWVMSLPNDVGDAKSVKALLRTIFEDKAEDFYIRKQAFSLLVHFSLLRRIRIETLIDILLDIDTQENQFILLSSIQFGSRLFNLNKGELSEWLSTMVHHTNAEVRSEAFTALGKMHLFSAFYPTSSFEFIDYLKKAKEKFELAESEIENRVDAQLLRSICQLLLSLQANEPMGVEESNAAIKNYLWEFICFNTKTEETLFYVNLFNPLSVIVKIYRDSPSNWIDFKLELNAFLIRYLEFDLKLTCESLFAQEFLIQYGNFLKSQLVEELLINRFQTELARLKRLKEEQLLENDFGVALVDEIIEKIVLSGKKKVESNNLGLIAKFHLTFPSADLATVQNDLSQINVNDPLALSTLFFQYQSQYSNATSFTTGYSQGDFILKEVAQFLRQQLPMYPIAKFQEFVLVLNDFLKYFILAQRGGKDRFPYLFKADAKEKDLQDGLLSFLQFSERAEHYLPEVKEIADGGRVDIIYYRDAIQLPIEIKRSFAQPSWETIKESYLSQAQTYARTRDQLAFFVVLDLSGKDLEKPLPNTRDLYKVMHLDTESSLSTDYPDYVVAFVIPGNKPLPSARSTYK